VDSLVQSFQIWIKTTYISSVMTNVNVAWPISESIHFVGLCLLLGTVGLFDLRMMGLVKQVPIAALHRLIPLGILGYVMNVLTGITFLSGYPDQYIYNPAFQSKLMFMGIAGVNVVIFYLTMYRRVAATGATDEAPLFARIAGGVSLVCWLGVIVCGRLITFFRPPWHWCPWC
jgi:uncharacterized membrane protein